MTQPHINESYLIKQIQRAQAARIFAVMAWLGDPKAVDANNNSHLIDDTKWRKDNQVIYAYYDHHDARKNCSVTFSSPFYDPNLSHIWYGTPVKVDDVDLTDDGQSKVFDNRKGKGPVHVAFEQEITLENSVEHSFAESMTFDTSVSSETTVSGSYGGVSAEEKVTASFGFSDEQSTSETKAESASASDKVAIEFDVPAGQCTLLEITKEKARTTTPFSVDGILDASLVLDFYDWTRYGHGGWSNKYTKYLADLSGDRKVSLESLNTFNQWARGFDTNYPHMHGFIEDCGAAWGPVNWIKDPANRRIQLKGDKLRTLEKNASYKTTSLGSAIPEALAHLPVEQASDVGE